MSEPNLRIYAAGKIAKNDWRGVRNEWYLDDGPWPTVRDWMPGLDYTGPFFLGDDHGCAHGRGTHALDVDCVNPVPDWQAAAVARCLGAIDSSDFVFAWLDDPTAYGTLVEIGYATGKGIPVVVASPEVPKYDEPEWPAREAFAGPLGDLWFAFAAASAVIQAPSPREALAYMMISGTIRKDREYRQMFGSVA